MATLEKSDCEAENNEANIEGLLDNAVSVAHRCMYSAKMRYVTST